MPTHILAVFIPLGEHLLMGNSYENNEPQRRRERRDKNLCESVSSVDKFSFHLVRRRHMGNSCEENK